MRIKAEDDSGNHTALIAGAAVVVAVAGYYFLRDLYAAQGNVAILLLTAYSSTGSLLLLAGGLYVLASSIRELMARAANRLQLDLDTPVFPGSRLYAQLSAERKLSSSPLPQQVEAELTCRRADWGVNAKGERRVENVIAWREFRAISLDPGATRCDLEFRLPADAPPARGEWPAAGSACWELMIRLQGHRVDVRRTYTLPVLSKD